MHIKKLAAVVAASVISVTAVTVTAAAAGTKVPITEKYFPDEGFREYVSQFDTDGNGYLSQKERNAVQKINVGVDWDNYDIDRPIVKSLKGSG